MIELFPCPQGDCNHWNAPGRAKCWACQRDLTGIDAEAAVRAARPRRRGAGSWLLAVGAVVAVIVVAVWFLRGRSAASDQEPPRLVLTEPVGREVRTNAETLQLRGRVEDENPDRVEAGGQSAKVRDGEFELEAPVPPGGGSLRVVALDRAGNASEPLILEITVDREAPTILRMEPEDGATIVTRTLRLSGEAGEDLSSVSIQGEAGEIDGPRFVGEHQLTEGGNTVLLTLTDLAGNSTERSLSVRHEVRSLPAGFSSAGRSSTGHELFTAAKDGARLVLVPETSFRRGSEDGDSDERPVKETTLSTFFIQVGPVTNGQYARFLAATGGRQPPAPDFDASYFEGQPEGPVVNLTWEEARAYAEWSGRTLPTEAQWELAARGPTSLRWPWGNAPAANFNGKGSEDGFAGASPVGSFPAGASPFGLVDMAGNVWEWTLDRYSPTWYGRAAARDPAGPGSGNERSLRGGAYTSDVEDVRSANRWRQPAGSRRSNVGFRTVVAFPE